ncbi:hypothetical protein K505DRAFT_335263 [Melanomma pulvis-pyrius CBS 109.77]|uniref:Uncharacterized protein n=1 Tax=Melanomma pulvis-pyrius CBS 109.77 TaxID=1314802 RepID=A0A6A6XIV3_9PLEO|nr:hypothetical protein K505DRAFT_335263 [Melanomma pulvis-pyrius CBS 109.77]
MFLCVRSAGKGLVGEVFFCVPKSDSLALKRKNKEIDMDATGGLLSQAATVKMTKPSRDDSGAREANIMQKILQSVENNEKRQYSQLLDTVRYTRPKAERVREAGYAVNDPRKAFEIPFRSETEDRSVPIVFDNFAVLDLADDDIGEIGIIKEV